MSGNSWITFKDPCNIRSPQQHVGVVHSSNLCTEITLNTNDAEIAVCNLGSVNLLAHLKQAADGTHTLDHDKLKRTITTAMRMLDNVIDINYYAVDKARNSNVRHRPVGDNRRQHGFEVVGWRVGDLPWRAAQSDQGGNNQCVFHVQSPKWLKAIWGALALGLPSAQERGHAAIDKARTE